jgi:HEAT repeat protein
MSHRSMAERIARRLVAALGILAFLTAAPFTGRAAQDRKAGAMDADEARLLAQGWALIGEGRSLDAVNLAAGAMTRFPNSLPVLTLAVQADIAASGSPAALTRYEAWLGAGTLEEPGVLRVIARAALREFASESQNPRGQIAALEALASTGDAEAAERLQSLSKSGNPGGIRALAEMGDPQALNLLIADLGSRTGNKLEAIEILGRSGSPAALGVLVTQLGDREPAVRGAAADALGRLGTPEAVSHLKPLLNDESAHVRMKAAAGLMRLGDASGVPLLTPLLAHDDPRSRLVGAMALESRADASWLSAVRELTTTSDPHVRLLAAKLLAPHDPSVSVLVLEALAADANPAIREDASRSLAADVIGDLPTLRALLKRPDRLTRIAAARKILTLGR